MQAGATWRLTRAWEDGGQGTGDRREGNAWEGAGAEPSSCADGHVASPGQRA